MPGRIVAAVFQPPQAVQDDGHRFPVPDVADDAAHIQLRLVQELDPVFFNHRIGENFVGDLLHFLADAASILLGLDGHVEELALPDAGDGLVAQAVQGAPDGLPLGSSTVGFGRYIDAYFHG